MSLANRAVFSSASDHWATPRHVYDALNAEFAFTFDPCPLMSRDDAMQEKWTGSVYCNPPYSRISEFLKKGLFHLANGDCSSLVYLIPSRTDTQWFHEYCIRASEIRFLRGRLKFGDAVNSAPFPSMLVIFLEWKLNEIPLEAA